MKIRPVNAQNPLQYSFLCYTCSRNATTIQQYQEQEKAKKEKKTQIHVSYPHAFLFAFSSP